LSHQPNAGAKSVRRVIEELVDLYSGLRALIKSIRDALIAGTTQAAHAVPPSNKAIEMYVGKSLIDTP
jgi:hypothetical protein